MILKGNIKKCWVKCLLLCNVCMCVCVSFKGCVCLAHNNQNNAPRFSHNEAKTTLVSRAMAPILVNVYCYTSSCDTPLSSLVLALFLSPSLSLLLSLSLASLIETKRNSVCSPRRHLCILIAYWAGHGEGGVHEGEGERDRA